MISGSNQQLRQELEYTLLKPDVTAGEFQKCNLGREDTLEEWYAIKFCFKLGKNATETYGMLQTAFGPSCMNRASLSRTAFTLLGMEFTRASQVATGMLFLSSMDDVTELVIFWDFLHLYLPLEDPPKMFYWVQIWRHAWPVHHLYLSLFSKAVVILEVCLGSLSCWNTACNPVFWREGTMLCCSI